MEGHRDNLWDCSTCTLSGGCRNWACSAWTTIDFGRPTKQQLLVPLRRLLRRWSWAIDSGWRATDNRPKLREGKLCMEIKKSFVPARTIRWWNWLSGETAQTPSLDPFKDGVDRALSSLM